VRLDLGDAGFLLDAAAKAAYQSRIKELRAELDEADAFHDPAAGTTDSRDSDTAERANGRQSDADTS
jgi:hypothetical protein